MLKHIKPSFSVLLSLVFGILFAQDNIEDYFGQNCFSCHTIGGGRRTGPDLKNVHKRQNVEWLETFIQDPQSVISSGDAYANKLLRESQGVVMIKLSDMTPSIARALLNFIKEESLKENSKFKGLTLVDLPFTDEDYKKGQSLFVGNTPLQNNGPSCIGCHKISGEGFLGGGLLGPDLTESFNKIGGKTALVAWLEKPASAMMLPIFTKQPISEEEILHLVAFLKKKAEEKEIVRDVHDYNFMIFVLLGLVILLVILNLIFRSRLRTFSSPKIKGNLQ